MLLQDRNQNFWELACINGAALGLPGMLVSGAIAQKYGVAAALSSILIGNIFLWIVGMGIISMADNRKDAIENVKGYLGTFASIIAAMIWVLAFLIWYTLQIKSVSDALAPQIQGINGLVVSGMLGTSVALLGIGGIQLIKKICRVGLPLLVCYLLYALSAGNHSFDLGMKAVISPPGILAIILVWLPGAVNLPTFFRHSRSRPDTVFGLILMTFFHVFFQVSAVFLNVANPEHFLGMQGRFNTILGVIFILISFVISNLLNIYYASAGWETILPVKRNRVEYFLVGFLGTLSYLAFQFLPTKENIHFNLEFWESILSSFIACLGAVLLIAFLIRLVVQHRPKPFEKLWSSICWIIGCITALNVEADGIGIGANQALITGIVATVLSFLVIMFVEETVWAIKHVNESTKKKSHML